MLRIISIASSPGPGAAGVSKPACHAFAISFCTDSLSGSEKVDIRTLLKPFGQFRGV